MIIRKLVAHDAVAFKDIRLEMLKNYPSHFWADYKEQATYNDEYFIKALETDGVFGAFVGDDLIGTAGVWQEDESPKMKHRGMLWAVYVRPAYRGQGLSQKLVAAVISHARTIVDQLHLTVESSNTAAIKVYEKLGFVFYGREPRSLKIDGKYYDEDMMVLIFNE